MTPKVHDYQGPRPPRSTTTKDQDQDHDRQGAKPRRSMTTKDQEHQGP